MLHQSLLLPTAPLAPRVVLPDDPGVALALATEVLGEGRLMFNHHRGLWGYSGTATDGEPLTIQSTGVGGASAVLVLRQLAALGARTVVRTGRAWPLGPGHSGALAATAIAGTAAPLDPDLAERLARAAGASGPICSQAMPDEAISADAADALACDHESASLAIGAASLGLRFGVLVHVADEEPQARPSTGLLAAARAAADALVAASADPVSETV